MPNQRGSVIGAQQSVEFSLSFGKAEQFQQFRRGRPVWKRRVGFGDKLARGGGIALFDQTVDFIKAQRPGLPQKCRRRFRVGSMPGTGASGDAFLPRTEAFIFKFEIVSQGPRDPRLRVLRNRRTGKCIGRGRALRP